MAVAGQSHVAAVATEHSGSTVLRQRGRRCTARDALSAAERFRNLGGRVTAIDVGATNHEETIFAAVPHLVAWFDSLSAQPASAPPEIAR